MRKIIVLLVIGLILYTGCSAPSDSQARVDSLKSGFAAGGVKVDGTCKFTLTPDDLTEYYTFMEFNSDMDQFTPIDTMALTDTVGFMPGDLFECKYEAGSSILIIGLYVNCSKIKVTRNGKSVIGSVSNIQLRRTLSIGDKFNKTMSTVIEIEYGIGQSD